MIQIESGDEDDITLIEMASGARPIEDLAVRMVRRRKRAILAGILGFVLLGGACAIAAMLAWRDAAVTNQLLDMRAGGRSAVPDNIRQRGHRFREPGERIARPYARRFERPGTGR
jgi:hypothetical protein